MENENQVVSTGEWIITIIVACIPLIGFIMSFVWAFSSPQKSKANFFKAWIILSIILYVLGFIFSGVILGMFVEFLNNLV